MTKQLIGKELKRNTKEIFNNKEVKSKANCKACHSDVEKRFN